jgi:hypothetical protein
MSFNFISEVAIYLGKKNNSNLASLYLLKFVLAEVHRVRKEAEQRQNVINHGEWNLFVQTPEFANSFKILDNIGSNVQKAFEFYYTQVMGLISQQFPQVAQGITSNLGSSPYAPIAPEIPIYELQNNWLSTLGNSPEEYFTKIEIMVVISLLQKKVLDLDFTAVEMMKKSATMEEIVTMFEEALKRSPMMSM